MQVKENIELAKQSVLGVSIGDAFGDSFFGAIENIDEYIYRRKIPCTRWEFTDDTVMSIAILEELETDGHINQDRLVKRFIKNLELDPNRGYGATLRMIMREIADGKMWQDVSPTVFDGQGSMGNGAAMRVCPLGAYYYNDLERVKNEAILASEITHSNTEAINGAIAVAISTALATRNRINKQSMHPDEFLDSVCVFLDDTDTKSKIEKAKHIPISYHIQIIKQILGNGTNMTAQDTVPFALWCVANYMQNFEEALWKAVSILGDRDTICAIVGGITIMNANPSTIPNLWTESVEDYNYSIFRNNN